ncbi:unnamed protein product [Rotaria sordida]|uniref:Uncharacterized protein n=1 Tax=Rotaria sordida TaxID=392033 RepID=A0A814SLN7_9BILA|nr:unnamed protein product [Rotaria sordida]CAF1150035.1 unnamed protein product [Rotaria sordida]
MHLVIFVLLLISCACDIKVFIDQIKGQYNISIDNQIWFHSSRTALYVNNRWYSSNDSTVPLIDTRFVQCNDPNLGNWNETQLIYILNRNGIISNITGHIRQWNSQSALTFHLDTGDKILMNNKLLDKNQIRTIFPSFNIEQIDGNDNRGVIMGFDSQHAGIWNSSSEIIRNSLEGGPVILFDLNKKGQDNVVIISSFSQFMAISLNQQDNILQYGVMGSMITIPVNYSNSLILFYSSEAIGGGVSQWKSRPDGLPTLYRQMETLLIDNINQLSLPIGNDLFRIDLLSEAAHDCGLIMYEQDWLHVQSSKFIPLLTDIDLDRQWLMSTSEGADKVNITIQYCSSFPRYALQTLEISRVTQARVSVDYTRHIVHREDQWTIGISSLLSDALDIAPFKDVFWSTTNEPGSAYKPSPMEPLPEREIVIAILSTGPVSPGDVINYTDSKRITKCCQQDGLILKPDRPITMIDLLISDWSQNNGNKQGELYSTQPTI